MGQLSRALLRAVTNQEQLDECNINRHQNSLRFAFG